MKMLSKYIVATAVATSLIASAGSALAQTNSVPPTDVTAPKSHARHDQMIDKMFAKLDPQNTGVITIDAFLKHTDARFDKIDTKKQGFIDKDELTAFVGTSHADLVDRIMKRLDTDNDGKITKAEFEKPMRKRFALLDLNDDGKITRDEASLAGPIMMPHDQHGKWQHRHEMNDQQPTAQ